MSREKNLIKNTGILALGDFFPKFLTVLITPILTSKLSRTEYGEYDLIITIVTLLLPIATLQISSATFRFLIDVRNRKEECKSIISTILVFVTIMSCISGLLYYVVIGYRNGMTGLFVAIYFVSNMYLMTTQQIMRGLGKNLLYSIGSIIQAVVSLVCIFSLLGGFSLPNLGINGVVISLMLSTSIPFIVLLIKGDIWDYFKLDYCNIKTLKKLLNYSWPMVPNNLSVWVLSLSDRIVITAALGIEANAVYAVANKLPTIISSMQGTFIMAWQENASLAKDDSDKDEYYSKMCDWIFRLLTGVIAGLIMCTPVIWKILIRGDYKDAYSQLPLLYIAMMFSCMSSSLGGIYIAHMKTKSVGLTTMAAAAVNLIIDIAFVRVIGIWAGSISTVISYFILWIYRMIDVQKIQHVKINYKNIVASITMLLVMAYLCARNQFVFNILNVFLCMCTIVVFDRDILLFFIYRIKKMVELHSGLYGGKDDKIS